MHAVPILWQSWLGSIIIATALVRRSCQSTSSLCLGRRNAFSTARHWHVAVSSAASHRKCVGVASAAGCSLKLHSMDELLGVFLEMSAPLCVSGANHKASPRSFSSGHTTSRSSLSRAASEKEQCNSRTISYWGVDDSRLPVYGFTAWCADGGASRRFPGAKAGIWGE